VLAVGCWRSVECGLFDAYREYCATIGQQVRVELPGSRELVGTAFDLNPDGQLMIRTVAGSEHAVHAGDVVHLRSTIR